MRAEQIGYRRVVRALREASELRSDGQAGGLSHKRPTDKQRWVLEQLVGNGHIEAGDGQPRVLVTENGERHPLQDSTYWVMQDRGWLWQTVPHVWRITTAGRAVVARRRK